MRNSLIAIATLVALSLAWQRPVFAGENLRLKPSFRAEYAELAVLSDSIPASDLSQLGITLKPGFSDRARAIIATAVGRIPACRLADLRGLVIYPEFKKAVRVPGGFDCDDGETYTASNSRVVMKLNTNAECKVPNVAVTIHELFHVLHLNNSNLSSAYRDVYRKKIPGCPVSEYAKAGFYEDFAECGRLLVNPDSNRLPRACVDQKISEIKRILDCQ